MSKLLVLLLAVHDLPMKTNYSEQHICTDAVNLATWSKLSKSVEDGAL